MEPGYSLFSGQHKFHARKLQQSCFDLLLVFRLFEVYPRRSTETQVMLEIFVPLCRDRYPNRIPRGRQHLVQIIGAALEVQAVIRRNQEGCVWCCCARLPEKSVDGMA